MKILYVTTVSNTINAFLIPHIKMLQELGHRVDVACKIVAPLSKEIEELGCEINEIQFTRSAMSPNNIKCLKQIKSLILKNDYDLVHTHTPIVSALVRIACRNLNDVRIIYTIHGLHFFKGAPIRNWLLYYPIEKWLSKYTDTLITINKEDYNLAKNIFSTRVIEYIPGIGLSSEKFSNVIVDRDLMRKKFGLSDQSLVLLSVGELNKNKNHKVLIKALSILGDSNTHLIICGEGPLKDYLSKLARKLKVDKQVHLIGYIDDIQKIYKISDIFVFPSLREGLGMAALEAMASGLPIITSNLHGIIDYNTHGETGFLCNPKDVNEFAKAIDLLKNDCTLRNQFVLNNKKTVEKYELKNSLKKMHEIYEKYEYGE